MGLKWLPNDLKIRRFLIFFQIKKLVKKDEGENQELKSKEEEEGEEESEKKESRAVDIAAGQLRNFSFKGEFRLFF